MRSRKDKAEVLDIFDHDDDYHLGRAPRRPGEDFSTTVASVMIMIGCAETEL